jgi:hypothetical protein
MVALLKFTLEHYVGYSLQPTTKATKANDMTVNLEAPTNVPA